MNAIKRWLSPPVFPDDPGKTRAAAILNLFLLVNIGTWFLALFSLPFSSSAGVGLVIIVSLFVVGGGAFIALRTGHVYGVAQWFVILLWLVSTAMIMFTGGVSAPETASYIVVIIFAGLLRGIRSMWVFVGLSIVGVIAIFLLDILGLLPPPLLEPGSLAGMVIGIINPLLVSTAFYMALVDLRRALAATQRNEQALAERNRDLEAVRASLEEQVTTRTQAAEAARLEVEAANTALQEQMWQIMGLAQLSEIQPSGQGVAPLATAALGHICRYVEAAVGALYLWEGRQLALTSTYAYPVEQARNRHFALGEGLIGQVAAEGRPHILTAEATPLRLNSSFGKIALAQAYVYPLMYGGTGIGVLEIGRLTPFTPAQIQFLTQAQERLAVVIHTLQAQVKINVLLQETQQQAEELKAQEEELRAANEELQTQTEALRAKAARG